MPIPQSVTRFNRSYLNKGMIHLAGHGPFVELEHVGRTSGRVYHVPLMAFRDGPMMTLALTYGPDVDWLKNLRAAGSGRMLWRGKILSLGAPQELPTSAGMARMPFGPRQILPLTGTTDFVELPIVGEEKATRDWRR